MLEGVVICNTEQIYQLPEIPLVMSGKFYGGPTDKHQNTGLTD